MMDWVLFLLCVFAIIGMIFTLGMVAMLALFFFEMKRK